MWGTQELGNWYQLGTGNYELTLGGVGGGPSAGQRALYRLPVQADLTHNQRIEVFNFGTGVWLRNPSSNVAKIAVGASSGAIADNVCLKITETSAILTCKKYGSLYYWTSTNGTIESYT